MWPSISDASKTPLLWTGRVSFQANPGFGQRQDGEGGKTVLYRGGDWGQSSVREERSGPGFLYGTRGGGVAGRPIDCNQNCRLFTDLDTPWQTPCILYMGVDCVGRCEVAWSCEQSIHSGCLPSKTHS